MIPDTSELIVIAGNQGSGKSTVARSLARRFACAAVVSADVLHEMIVTGGQWPEQRAMSEPARQQLNLRLQQACFVAASFVDAGITAVLEDSVVGERVDHMLDHLAGRRLHFVMLNPNAEAIRQREASRGTELFDEWAWLDDTIQNHTPRIGLWLDSSQQSPNETVDEILARVWSEGVVDLSSRSRGPGLPAGHQSQFPRAAREVRAEAH